MNTEIKIGSKIVCPVTDSEGEVSHCIGILVNINSRWATVNIEGEQIKVGKTKIELLDEPVVESSTSSTKERGDYQNCRAASGRKSLDNGDVIALSLRGQTLEFAYEVASEHLGESITSLKSKYIHLNPGQQRMCLGNRLRKSR